MSRILFRLAGILSIAVAVTTLAVTASQNVAAQPTEGRAVKPATVRVAGIVLKWIRADKEANVRRIEPMIRQAAAGGAKIVCTTECFLDGYAIADKSIPLETYLALGEPIPDGQYYRKLAALAAELKIFLVAGMLEADGKARYNSAVLISPEGKLAGKYRKQELGHELARNTPGNESRVFETPYGRLGILICADRTIPEIVRRFRGSGADFLLCPSGGMFGPKRNDPIVQARSRENRLPIIFVHPAEFLVTAPDGSIVEQTILGDVLLIDAEQTGGQQDQNRIFYFDLQSAVPQASPGRGAGGAAPPAAQQPAVPMKVGPPEIVDYTDPTYGARIRQLRKDDGHEHNLYYYREVFNADGSRMLGIQSDLQQKDWRVCLYDGDGLFLKELFPISKYDWRLCWDHNDPNVLYTHKGSDLCRLDVTTGQAEVLKSFGPDLVHWNGPSVNQAGDRILVITTDEKHQRTFRSYHLPDMSGERTFQITAPPGCTIHWDKPHYTGYRNYIDTAYSSSDPAQPKQGIVVYDDMGAVVHRFEDIGGGGHYDWSPDGKLAYFKLPAGGRGAPETPLEIHVVNLDGSGDRILFSVPRQQARFHNLHLSWPRQVNQWFVAGFFPSGYNATPRVAKSAPGAYQPPFDEILMLRLDGTTKYLARTETVYSSTPGRGRAGAMFWAQPLPRPSADGKRIAFNSNRSGTVDQYILYVDAAGKQLSAPGGR